MGRPGPLHNIRPTRSRWRAYLALTKPRIIAQLVITTIPAMILAANGWPGTWLVLATSLGGALAAGSANAFNMYLDRDIDAVMHRTSTRPLVTGEVSPQAALVFGASLGVTAVTGLAMTTTVMAAGLTAAAIGLYVVFYTMILKRRTSQNIVWGGAAGCMPVLIGWSAVTGSLALTPLLLFLVVFLWTPAHYWPLALAYREDYADAGVPMLPVHTRATAVAWRAVGYAGLLLALTVGLAPVAGLGAWYLVPAAGAGAWFLLEAVRLVAQCRAQQQVHKQAMRTFRVSLVFLSVMFLTVALDPLLT